MIILPPKKRRMSGNGHPVKRQGSIGGFSNSINFFSKGLPKGSPDSYRSPKIYNPDENPILDAFAQHSEGESLGKIIEQNVDPSFSSNLAKLGMSKGLLKARDELIKEAFRLFDLKYELDLLTNEINELNEEISSSSSSSSFTYDLDLL
jgi:hypothetical protein